MSINSQSCLEINRSQHLFGISVAIGSAISFGLVAPFAAISYAGGANAITFAIVRAVAMSLVAILLVFLLKRDWRVPRAAIPSVFLVVVGQTGLSVGILCSVQYIPVSLAILIMYIYPALVFIIESVSLRERFFGKRAINCISAFIGLILVLGASFHSLDWRGIAFASLACVSTTILMLAMRSARQHVNEVAIILWGNSGSLPVMVILWSLLGGIALPSTQLAWMALAAGACFFVLAFSGYSVSMRYISAGRAAMIYNIEPLVAIIAAVFILHEVLAPLQMIGASLVIAAVIVSARV